MFTSLEALTYGHVAISLAAIAAGFVVAIGMARGRRLDGWTAAFLATTILTSVTGFFFPFRGVTPGIVFGVVSLILLAVALYARHAGGLAGINRGLYVVTAMVAFYLNFVVLIVQSFQKVPALHALAPTQSEAPFLAAQVVALAGFLFLGYRALVGFRPPVAPAA
ncbi:hypothetical protein OJF2_36260 [Aquisphaera giovannonii]|uniref:Uncharacterized protein n=1 Tax=Aquisphaera giovannonii TaxID=406548 RepID=A0A5B9W4X8_9BACT|nr:hypothetical protein [Aquisphaera giovannonii]QEH35081.1 hypothetical protein OJF2_36260 [Aquisphaera giovannonii]